MPDLHLLLVDDEEELLTALSSNLVTLGYRVTTATGGVDAFILFQKEHIDIVLTDMNMPNGSGYELIKKIKNLRPKTPIIAFLTDNTQHSAINLKKTGVNMTISKPFSIKELDQSIRLLI